jgi:hypothetical protein
VSRPRRTTVCGARLDTLYNLAVMKPAMATGVTFEKYSPSTAGDQACSNLNGDWPNRLAKVTKDIDARELSVVELKKYLAGYEVTR